LVNYPLCLLEDLSRYEDFVGRGCPAQAGHRMSINASGDAHACVHEQKSYGNIFEIGIAKAYQNMRDWHTGKYRYDGCHDCRYLEICMTGCRMSALGYFGKMNGPDQLMKSPNGFATDFNLINDPEFEKAVAAGLNFTVPSRLRFRKEDGFYLVNIRWANTITVPTNIAEFLLTYQKSGKTFDLQDMSESEGKLMKLLFYKDAIESKGYVISEKLKKQGLSINPLSLVEQPAL